MPLRRQLSVPSLRPPVEFPFDNSIDVASQTIEAIETFYEAPTLPAIESGGVVPRLNQVSAHCFGIFSLGAVLLCLGVLLLGAIGGILLKRT
ncbi:hypothetical protein QR680_011049 [Steinernema hermaphroditum]|uniref:Uncharacterized protein n=1 Tax=Steinernema hermaphroditum TaxID=289476 RepID=A0AA39ITG3_9BILA|nr:hypothetical protein QR680_011049 [Steinernema hermaphroditum]